MDTRRSPTRPGRSIFICSCRLPADWSAATGLLSSYADWLEVHADVTGLGPPLARLRREIDRLPECYRSPDRLVLVRLGRVPAATLGVSVRGDAARLESCFVRPIARGSGVASALLDHVLDDLAAEGIRTVTAHVPPDETHAATRLLIRRGFRSVGGPADEPGTMMMAVDLRTGAPHDRRPDP